MATALRRYYRGHNLVTLREVPTAQSRVYHFDHQGTTQCLTDGTGAVTDRFASDAWGVPIQRTGTSINRQWYIGNSGYSGDQMIYARARYLTVRYASWLTVDPLSTLPQFGLEADNRYGYAEMSPSNWVDPSGLLPLVFRCFQPGYTKCANINKDVTVTELHLPWSKYKRKPWNGKGSPPYKPPVQISRETPRGSLAGTGASPTDCTKGSLMGDCSPLCKSYATETYTFEQYLDRSGMWIQTITKCRNINPPDCDPARMPDLSGSLAAVVGAWDAKVGVGFSLILDIWKSTWSDCNPQEQRKGQVMFLPKGFRPPMAGLLTYKIVARREIETQWFCCECPRSPEDYFTGY